MIAASGNIAPNALQIRLTQLVLIWPIMSRSINLERLMTHDS
jgi:hypothetical protein